MAERVGFEPTEPVKVQQFSRLPDSTTLAPLRTSELKIIRFDVGNFKLACESAVCYNLARSIKNPSP